MTIEERLEKVEHELSLTKRRNRYLVLVVGLLMVCFVLAGFTAQAKEKVPEVIVARAFHVVDAAGKLQAALDVDKAGSMLGLYDDAGNPRVVLGVGKGPVLGLYDDAGTPRVVLDVGKDGTDGPRVILRDAVGKPRVALGVGKDGPQLLLYTPDENVIWSAP